MDNSLLAFVLLVGALLVFLVSTRQWALGPRSLIWLIGAALLAASAYLSFRSGGHDDLLRAAIDAFKEREDSVLFQAVEGNRDFIVAYVAPMLDLFLAFGLLAGLLALLAFTPGEGIERVVRALGIAVLGGVAGGLVALVVVAVGFGGYPQRQVLFDIMAAEGVVDGDTIRLGDVSVRLYGIDAPEYAPDNNDGSRSADNQICYLGSEVRRCGEEARNALASFTEGRVVVCSREYGPRDQWGRVLVQCDVRVDSATRFNLAYRLAKEGFVAAYESNGASDLKWKTEIDEARKAGRGIWTYCMLKPSVWRNNVIARKAFVDSNGMEWSESDVIDSAKCAKPVKGKGK